MEKGIIRWFDNKKGYGFIQKESDGKDLFVHYSAINMEGYKTLKAKEQVQFNIVDGEKGPQAADVARVAVSTEEKPKVAKKAVKDDVDVE